LGKDVSPHQKKMWLLKNISESMLQKAKRSIENEEKYPDQISPDKHGIMNLKFSKYSKRHEDSVLLKNPFPGNSRMEPPSAHEGLFSHAPTNIEVLSRAKRTTSIPRFEL
jgi:hypothetical protein